MFRPRLPLFSVLRNGASQFPLIPRRLPRASRNVSSIANGPTPRSSLWPRRLLYTGIFGGLGYLCSSIIIKYLFPPLGPEIEKLWIESQRKLVEDLTIVKVLREDPDWVEGSVYGSFSEDEKDERLTSGPLGGMRGLPVQKVFWNTKEKKAINVVYIGKGADGFLYVTHGGALATILDEHLARVAIQHLPERTAVTANLDVNYRAPALSGRFYYVEATLDQQRSTDRKAYVIGKVCDVEGNSYVDASGLFVVPRGYKLRKLGETY
ncbi:HotDog domain-containing protein [Aspergillus californicus]